MLAAAMALGGFATWCVYALRTTFAYDDYSLVSKYVLDLPEHVQSYRPGYALTTGAMSAAFGTHPHLYYVATEAFAGLVVGVLFLALRRLGLPRLPALLASALLIAEPRADSLHLWWTASAISMALALSLAALAVGAGWLKEGRHRWWWLLGGEMLLAAAVLTYESVAVIIMLGPALVFVSPSWRRTGTKLVIDMAVAALCALYMFTHTDPAQVAQATPPAQYFEHWRHLVADGYHVFIGSLPSFIGGRGLAAGGAAAALTIAVGTVLIVRHATPAGFERGFPRSRAAAIVASATLLFCAGLLAYAPFIPANAYYTATAPGVGNRTNAASQIFFVTAFGLLAGELMATLLAPRPRLRGMATAAAGAALMGALLAGGAYRSAADARQFTAAARLRHQLLTTIASALPAPAHGQAILLGDYARYRGSELVPILAESWDSTGAIRLLYRDPSLTGRPIDPATRCVTSGIMLSADSLPVPYTGIQVIDVGRGVTVPVNDLQSCQARLPGLVAVHIDLGL